MDYKRGTTEESKETEESKSSTLSINRTVTPVNIHTQPDLSCFYSNIDSFLNKREEIKVRIEEESPDVIGFTEIKSKNPRYVLQEPELVIDGYDCWHTLYTKTSLQATPANPPLAEPFQDEVWCEIRL